MRRRHMVIELGQALDFSDVPFIHALPALRHLPVAFPAFGIRQCEFDFEGLAFVRQFHAFDNV